MTRLATLNVRYEWSGGDMLLPALTPSCGGVVSATCTVRVTGVAWPPALSLAL